MEIKEKQQLLLIAIATDEANDNGNITPEQYEEVMNTFYVNDLENGMRLATEYGIQYKNIIQESQTIVEAPFMEINYGLIAVDAREPEEVLHFCGYTNEPKQAEYNALVSELKHDEEFGLTELGDNLLVVRASEEIVAEYHQTYLNDRSAALN